MQTIPDLPIVAAVIEARCAELMVPRPDHRSDWAAAAERKRMNAGSRRILDALKADEAELRRLGVRRLALFGSAARGQDRADSDIDLLAGFDPARRLSLLDIVHIENDLSDLLERRVELVEEGCLRPRAQAIADKDLIIAFWSRSVRGHSREYCAYRAAHGQHR